MDDDKMLAEIMRRSIPAITYNPPPPKAKKHKPNRAERAARRAARTA
jgi:hypothetical protein